MWAPPMASISSVTDLAVPKAEEHSQIDVSAYDVMGRMVLVERYVSLFRHQPIAVIEAILRISHVTVLVNALFWSTQWSTQI